MMAFGQFDRWKIRMVEVLTLSRLYVVILFQNIYVRGSELIRAFTVSVQRFCTSAKLSVDCFLTLVLYSVTNALRLHALKRW